MGESENNAKRFTSPSKPVLVGLCIGVFALGACIPRAVNHISAITPVSEIDTTNDQLTLNGRVESDEIKLAMVLPGTVAEVAVKEGQHVTKGQVLVRLNAGDAEIESRIKAIDQVIAATEKMKSKALVWLAEVKKQSKVAPEKLALNVKLPKSDVATVKKPSVQRSANARSAAVSNASSMADSVDSVAKSINVQSIKDETHLQSAENLESESSSSNQLNSAKSAQSLAEPSEYAAHSTETAALAPQSERPLSKKELKARYKEQLAKIDKSDKERRKNLKMGYAMVQALTDAKSKGSKSILASEDLKAAGFTDILKGEIIRSGMVDSSIASSPEIQKILQGSGKSDLLKNPAIQAEFAKAKALGSSDAAILNRIDPKLIATNLTKENSEALSQLLRTNAVTIENGNAKVNSVDADKISALLKAHSAQSADKKSTAESAALLRNQGGGADELAQLLKSKNANFAQPDIAALLKKAQLGSSAGSAKMPTLEIETEIAEAEAEIAKAKALKQDLISKKSATVLTSPVDGIISARNINPGEIVLPGRVLIRISSPDRFYVRAFIPEGQLSKVKIWQSATVYLDGEKDNPLTATVSAIDGEPSFTPENVYFKEDRVRQVFGIKLRIDNSNGAAKNGMPADAIVFLFEPKA